VAIKNASKKRTLASIPAFFAIFRLLYNLKAGRIYDEKKCQGVCIVMWQ
jgi:hypothetical protein